MSEKTLALFSRLKIGYDDRNMQGRISVTLSTDVLHALDRLVGPRGNRSKMVEEALIAYIEKRRRHIRDTQDRAALDEHSEALNQEAEEVLSYQVPV